MPIRCRESAVWTPTDYLRVLCQALAPVVPVGLRVLDRLAEQRLVVGGRVRGGRLAPAALGLLRVARQLAVRLALALLAIFALLCCCPFRFLLSMTDIVLENTAGPSQAWNFLLP